VTPTPGGPDEADLGKVARGGAVNLAGSAIAAVAGVAVTWLAARALVPAHAGALFAAVAGFALLASVVRLGTQTGLVYWIARLRTLGAHELVGGCLRVALTPVVILSASAAAALWFTAPAVAGVVGPAEHPAGQAAAADVATQLRVLALFLPFAALTDALLAATRGYRSMRPTVHIDKLFRPATQVGAVAFLAFLVHLGVGAHLWHFTLAWVAPFPIAMVAAAVALRRLARRSHRRPAAVDGADLPERLGSAFWAFTWPRAFAGLAHTALQRADILLVAAFAGFTAAALYAVAGRFVLVGQLVNQAIGFSVQPRLAELLTTRDSAGARALYQSATGWLVLAAWPAYLLTAVFAPLYLGVFGPEYQAAWPVVVVLAGAMLVAVACGAVDTVLAMAGRTTWNLGNVTLALAVMVGLGLVLVPRYGALGAAICFASATLVNNVLPLVQIWSVLRIHPFGRGTLVAIALAGACFGVLPAFVVGAWGPTPAAALVSVAAGATVYAAGCWRLRGRLRLAAFAGLRRTRPSTVEESCAPITPTSSVTSPRPRSTTMSSTRPTPTRRP
jgi:O-antigen/teichoic acid export membrane protein